MKYDAQGRELPDPTPVEVPLGYRAPKPLQELIKDMIRVQMSQYAEAQGLETFEEADDFDVGDDLDFDPRSEYELSDEQEEFALAPVPPEPPADRQDREEAENPPLPAKQSSRAKREGGPKGRERKPPRPVEEDDQEED